MEDPNPPIGSAAISTGNTTLTVTGERNTPGTAAPSSPDNVQDSNAGTQRPPQEPTFDECLPLWNTGQECFPAGEDAPAASTLPTITMNDLVAFSPAPVAALGEPGNLGIAGMPTNFVATASAHTRTGTLFGFPLTVRFTPVGYDFDYGDGDRAILTTGGQSWSSLGQAQFTPTSTSHVYQERGTYLADVDVRYTAEVDLGTGWLPVPGEMRTEGPDQEIRVFEAHTALVAYTCEQKPTGLGC
ncbi:hypothetical protein KZC51_13490 [Microbacterium sp. SSW1-49]|uniref:PKD domain-containing protein n=1 Tax=Microbacterium croceum TaxID=2851645 RepID=A0ABT0FHA3_9MICO|nr:hypothetical protein [Microbacterium croceum]MCK2037141.1 hypothetical protein [Microbacterium croceum]